MFLANIVFRSICIALLIANLAIPDPLPGEFGSPPADDNNTVYNILNDNVDEVIEFNQWDLMDISQPYNGISNELGDCILKDFLSEVNNVLDDGWKSVQDLIDTKDENLELDNAESKLIAAAPPDPPNPNAKSNANTIPIKEVEVKTTQRLKVTQEVEVNEEVEVTDEGVEVTQETTVSEQVELEEFIEYSIKYKDPRANTVIREDGFEDTKSPVMDQEESGGIVFPDAWELKDAKLSKGTVLYQVQGITGAKSHYLTNEETIGKCTHGGIVDIDKLKRMLQIPDQGNTKCMLVKYELTEDISAPTSIAEENFEYGEGGGRQYYLEASNEDKVNGTLKYISAEYYYYENIVEIDEHYDYDYDYYEYY